MKKKPEINPDRAEVDEGAKDRQLEPFRRSPDGQYLTTNQGVRVNHDDDSLKAGSRGPTLMEDFIFREKMMHFDHESIPERVVHARGSGAHGYFQVYESMSKFTRAKFLADPSVKTPVFVRFSTVVGSRGSADTVRDVRGFATKFYTEEGVFDLVGTTCRSSSSRTRTSSPTWCTPSSRCRTTRFPRRRRRTTPSGTSRR
jgi:catalase